MDNEENGKILAQAVIDKLSADEGFMKDGRRNDDGVDWCIACHVLGKDPIEGLKHVLREQGRSTSGNDYIQGRNKINVVSGYVEMWGPEGKEQQALGFMCRDNDYYTNDKEDQR